MKLNSVFSDNALFQAEAPLQIKGCTMPLKNVSVSLICTVSGIRKDFSEVKADASGNFTAEIFTPGPSFDTYDITVSSESDKVVMHDVLFGELWLSAGQSNMEMQNHYMDDNEKIYDALSKRNVRIFLQDWMGDLAISGDEYFKDPSKYKFVVTNWMGEFGCDPMVPYEPVYDTKGVWLTCSKAEITKTERASALTTSAILEIYDRLNEMRPGKNVPVGFINTAIGGTSGEAWMPREEAEKVPGLVELLAKYRNQSYDFKRWNTNETANYNQSSCLFNLKIAPLSGLKLQGVMWYQGENNVGTPYAYEIYTGIMEAIFRGYKKLFAYDERFTFAASQICPFLYTEDKCGVYEISKAIADTAEKYQNEFISVTNYDLKAYWQQGRNHPIHPAHKYELGKRFADVLLRNVHGVSGINSAATALQYHFEGRYACVSFNTRGEKLVVKGRNGFRIAGKNKIFFDADAEISDAGELVLHSESVTEPKYCAYNCGDGDWSPSLWCEDMPVTPFASCEDPKVQNHPWIFPEIDSCSIVSTYGGGIDCWKHATWQPEVTPLGACEVCRDDAFSVGKYPAVRIHGNYGGCGAYISSYPNARLDFNRYKGIYFELRYASPVKCSVVLECSDTDGNTFEAAASVTTEKILGFNRDLIKAEFNLPDFADYMTVKKAYFRFEYFNSDFKVCSVSMENFRLF